MTVNAVISDRLDTIKRLVLEADEVLLAVSFIRVSGVRLLRPLYLQSSARFSALVDTKQRITEKTGLEQLLDDNFALRSFVGVGTFHPKVWLFRNQRGWQAVVGSMNMSLAGLTTGIEACLLIDGEEAESLKDWFINLWNNPNQSKVLDSNTIRALPDAMHLMFTPGAPEAVPEESPSVAIGNTSINSIMQFIRDWTHDQAQIGQAKRRTGWTFRPAHGNFTQDKLAELQQVLLAMFNSGQTIFELNDISASQIIAHVDFSRPNHKTSARDLLIRVQINYLEKLWLVRKAPFSNNWDEVHITPDGISFMRSSQNQLASFVEGAIIAFNWFGIVNIYDFTKSLLLLLPDHKVSSDEFFLFVRHGGINAYSHSTPEQIAQLLLAYRLLSSQEKEIVWRFMERELNSNDTSPSKTVLANMANNWSPNMIDDLARCAELRKVNEGLGLK